MKKIAGFCCLIAAFFFFTTTRRGWKADDAQSDVLVERLAQAISRESDMASLRTGILMDQVEVANGIVNHNETTTASAKEARDQAELSQLQQINKSLGSSAVQRRALIDLRGHRKVLFIRAGLGVAFLLVALLFFVA
jgi:hypothetical protein